MVRGPLHGSLRPGDNGGEKAFRTTFVIFKLIFIKIQALQKNIRILPVDV